MKFEKFQPTLQATVAATTNETMIFISKQKLIFKVQKADKLRKNINLFERGPKDKEKANTQVTIYQQCTLTAASPNYLQNNHFDYGIIKTYRYQVKPTI